MLYVPIFWRYLLIRYGKTLLVSIVGFLLILLSTRLEDAARLIGLGASVRDICLYILYQIPYVLQVALPISSLIGAFYLFQRLSQTNELTAARASCIGLFRLLCPILLLAATISLLTFDVIFDVSVDCHLAAKQLEYRLRQTQPLAVLQNTRFLQERGIRYDMKGSLISDKNASDILVAMNDPKTGRFVLVVGKKLTSTDQFLHGRQLALIGTRQTPDTNFDTLYIENARENVTPLKDLSLFTDKRKMWKATNDYLTLPLLLAKKSQFETKRQTKIDAQKNPRRAQNKIGQVWVEIARRSSLAVAIITLTLLGASFGCSIGRFQSRSRFVYMLLYVALFLGSYLAAKSIQKKTELPIMLYLVPHVVLATVSIRRLMLIQKGVEV